MQFPRNFAAYTPLGIVEFNSDYCKLKRLLNLKYFDHWAW